MLKAIFSFPFLIANGFSILLLVLAFRKPHMARHLLCLLFSGAAVFNVYKALSDPGIYMYYGDVAVFPLYEQFIKGAFRHHIPSYILGIGILQAFIGVGVAWEGWLHRIALAAAIVFLVAIAPLGTGAAFPSSILMAAACMVLLERYNAEKSMQVKSL